MLNFHSDLYIPLWLGKVFKFLVFRLLENAFTSQKIESTLYAHTPPRQQYFEHLSPQAEEGAGNIGKKWVN